MNPEMTNALHDVVGTMPAGERRATVTALSEFIDRHGNRTTLSRLFRGIRAEILAAGFREDEVIAALEADRRADLAAFDLQVNGEPPAVEGEPFWPLGGGPEVS